MLNIIKKNYLFFSFIYILVMYSSMTFLATLGIPSKLLTLLIYVPTFTMTLIVIYKWILGYKKKRFHFGIRNLDKMLFILIILYSAFLIIYRFACNLDYLEGFHFAARLIGSIGLFYLVLSDDSANTSRNLIYLTAVLDIVLIIDFMINRTFRDTVILSNVLIVCCSMLILAINCLNYIRKVRANSILVNCIFSLHLFVIAIITMISGSRTMLWFGLATIIYTVITIIIFDRKKIIYLTSIIIALLFTICLYIINFGDVRFTVDKQLMSIAPSLITQTNESSSMNDITSSNRISSQPIDADTSSKTSYLKQNNALPKDSEANTNNTEEILNLERNSDYMRSILIEKGWTEFKNNVLFGTGNVYFEYQLGDRLLEQTAHNFIIETLIAFGIIGTLIILLFIVSILSNIFVNKKISLISKLDIVIACLITAGFAFTQQLLYNYFILPLIFALIAMIQSSEAKEE